jgi:hypothetical protein
MIISLAEENPLIVETDDGPAEFVFSPFQWRIGLAQAVRDALVKPIHPNPWFSASDGFEQARDDRAATHHVSGRQIITRVAQSAFTLALPDVPGIRLGLYGEPVPGTVEGWCRALKTKVSLLATKDLLGVQATEDLLGGQRRRQRRSQPASRLATAERNVALELDYFMASGRLTAHEARIVEAPKATDVDFQKVADQFQMTYGALTTALQRIRAKTA